MRVALIGTRGVPARYGGFETAIEEVGSRLAERGVDVTVFCRRTDDDARPETYRGMRLVHLPALRRRSLETLSHTFLSVMGRSLAGTDAAIVFNAANAPLLPVLRARGIPVATHVDGLEWRRSKWGPAGRRYYRAAESLAVRWSDALIADATGIADYYSSEFAAPTHTIAYGAPIIESSDRAKLQTQDLQPYGYHLVVARFEPENHVREIVEGYVASSAERPLVVVGSAPYSDRYTEAVRRAADGRVRFLGGIWDQELLDELYANSLTYLHGHSVGGTNPSLLRAAGAGAHVIAFDVSFNREVLSGRGALFATPADVAARVEEAEHSVQTAREDGRSLREDIRRYAWDDVTESYLQLLDDLALGRMPGRRPSGRRLHSATEAEAAE